MAEAHPTSSIQVFVRNGRTDPPHSLGPSAFVHGHDGLRREKADGGVDVPIHEGSSLSRSRRHGWTHCCSSNDSFASHDNVAMCSMARLSSWPDEAETKIRPWAHGSVPVMAWTHTHDKRIKGYFFQKKKKKQQGPGAKGTQPLASQRPARLSCICGSHDSSGLDSRGSEKGHEEENHSVRIEFG